MKGIKAEWAKVKEKPFTAIVLIALACVPMLYAIFFLTSYWDPYGKTEELPVTVVNLDEPYNYEGERVAIGEEFVDKLADNDSFNWQIESDLDEALNKLDQGDTYMVIEIPESFSKTSTTLLDESPEKMALIYHTNPGKNYVASQIGTSAMTKLNEEIAREVTTQYAQTTFEQLKEVAKGLSEASDGSKKVDEGAGEVADGTRTLAENLATLASGTLTLEEGAGALQTGALTLQSGLHDADEGAATVADGNRQLADGLGTLSEGTGELTDGLSQLSEKGSELQEGSQSVTDGLASLQAGIQQSADGAATIDEKLDAYVEGMETVNTEVSNANERVQGVAGDLASSKEAVAERTESFQTSFDNVQSYLDQSESIPEEEKAALQELLNQVDPSQVVEASEGIEATVEEDLAGLQQLTDGLNTLTESSVALKDGISTLSAGQQQLLEGATQLSQGQSELNEAVVLYTSKVSEAYTGAEKLAEGSATAAENAGKLADGSEELAGGITQLADGSDQLAEGVNELSDGAHDLSDGSGQLADGSTELSDGSKSLADGTAELYEALKDGAEEANSVQTNDKTYEMFAAPTDLEQEKRFDTSKYGEGLAPYILSLGLFAGALMLSTGYPLRDIAPGTTSPWSWLAAKLTILLSVSLLATIVANTTLLYGLGLTVKNVPGFYAFTFLISITFGLIILFLVSSFNKVGQFIAFLLLLLQVAGSIGTFPKELLPAFYQTISTILPMTYSINGYHELLAIGQNPDFVLKQAAVLGSIAIGALILNLITATIRLRKQPVPATGGNGENNG